MNKINWIIIIFTFITCLSCNGIKYYDSYKITAKEKAIALKKIAKTLRDDGYAFNQTFDDIDLRLAAYQDLIDTTTTIGSFVSSLKPVFESYGVSHLRIRTPNQVTNRQKGTHVGIGASLVRTDTGYFVSRIVKNGVADLAGIKAGDYLINEDNHPITSRRQLKHTLGKVTTIQLKRNHTHKTFKVKYFEHPIFSKDSLYWHNAEIAVISINSFRSGTYDKNHVESMFASANQAKKIVLDLRSNGGGASSNLKHLLSMIIPSNVICQYFIYRKDHEGFVKEFQRHPHSFKELVNYSKRTFKPAFRFWWNKRYQGDIVVIIDENSGSAADIFPACVKDLKRGTIIGKKSIGHVLFGEVKTLNMGMDLLYPHGEAVRLNKTINLEGHGCKPDIVFSREKTANTAFIYQFITDQM
ncbi:S41 family peptidase [Aquimarina sp. AU474]|uniref:S41 family peptidase n=1 Tax=Aquimarina sp. AU474 TaxID=2108529 RepID=UPI000D69AAA6|nr:S41 family peptidase [Aquimarina sp. AU474]